jgi:basic membrane protein A and related proteins
VAGDTTPGGLGSAAEEVRRTRPLGKRWMLPLLMGTLVVAVVALSAGEHVDPASSASARRLRIGLVTPALSVADPWASAYIKGLHRAVRELGVKAQVRTPTAREGYAASLTEFAKLRYDLVISTGTPDLGVRPDLVARRYPRVRFASLDSPRSYYRKPPPNLTGIVLKREEAGYLAGYLAGLVETRRPRPRVVSAVGGFPYAGVETYIAGFRAGARRAGSSIRVLYGYSKSWTAPELCARVASRQIARGSGVVFNVSGQCGLGALQAAKRNHVWGVGVDFDQASLGPHILTSAVLRLDVALFETVRALRRNRYREGSNMVMGIRQGAVGLGRTSPTVPRSLKGRIDRIRQLIADGVIIPPTTLPR